MERHRVLRVDGAEVHVVGTVHGLRSEADLVERAFAEATPDAVGLAVSPEDLAGLEAYLEDPREAPGIPRDDPYVEHLARYGELAMPPPDLEAALRLAREAGVPATALDLDDAAYTDAVTEHVSTWQLFWQSRRERKLARNPPEPATPWEYALAWDADRRRSEGYEVVEGMREERVARSIRELADDHARVLAVVEVARLEGVCRRLEQGTG